MAGGFLPKSQQLGLDQAETSSFFRGSHVGASAGSWVRVDLLGLRQKTLWDAGHRTPWLYLLCHDADPRFLFTWKAVTQESSFHLLVRSHK